MTSRSIGIVALALATSAHVGSPNVFFAGKAGPYDIRVVVRPPEVVPGIARITVRTPSEVQRVTIRPVFWRAGSRGAPSADEARRLEGSAQTFEGSLWLMQRGAYSVDVTVAGPRGTGTVRVPVPSIATGRLAMSPALGALLAALAFVLCAGLVNIVYKGAGESLLEPAAQLDPIRRRRARRVAALAVPVLALALLGGGRWWRAVDRDYEQAIYRPSPMVVSLDGGILRLAVTDTLRQPPGIPSLFVPDHGKLMHLFLVRADDARAFAHLHPQPLDSSEVPPFATKLPPLPPGEYRLFGDVVHEIGFERTLVGSLSIPASPTTQRAGAGVPRPLDPDDAWYVGDAARERSQRLADGSTMLLEIVPNAEIEVGKELTIRIAVEDPQGKPSRLEQYLGMSAHAVVARLDGEVFVHLHPMGTITMAAQHTFAARDRGDTTQSGRLRSESHAMHADSAASPAPASAAGASAQPIEFPYAFPKSGSYRLFVQVKRNGRILTGAYAISVADSVVAR